MNEKLNKISKLLLEHKFSIANEINDDYQCGICKEIINNAYQAICGCNFCQECINRLIDSRVLHCPGNTDECSFSNLSCFVINHRLNIQISKLVLKCPNENCSHKCKLIDMDEHLSFCSIESDKYQFNDNDISRVRRNENLESSIDSQINMLIESMAQLRNEVKDLKLNNVRKDNVIESLRNEINAIKHENQELKTLMRNSDNNLWDKLNQVDIEMNDKCRNDTVKSIIDDVEAMKIDKLELEKQMKIIDRKCQELNGNVKAETDKLVKEMREMRNYGMTKKVEILCQPLDENETEEITEFLEKLHNGEIKWTIGKINEIKYMLSDYFFDFLNPYKMRLCVENVKNRLEFQLWIYRKEFEDDNLSWPMKANVKIEIGLCSNMNVYKSMTMPCTVDKPKNNNWKSSDVIYFHHSLLRENKLFYENCVVLCYVTFC